MNNIQGQNLGELLAKYSGVNVNDVNTLLADPKANKKQIDQLAKASYLTGKDLTANMKQSVIAHGKKSKAENKEFVNAFKQQITQDPFVTLAKQKPNIKLDVKQQSVKSLNPKNKNINKNINDDCNDCNDCKSGCKNENCGKTEDKCCTQLFSRIRTLLPCAPHIPINYLPFVCDQPGTYCLTRDLYFASAGNAIYVSSSNVELNFDNFKITLSQPASSGIYVDSVETVLVHNGQIDGNLDLPQSGIDVFNTTSVKVQNMKLTNLMVGIVATINQDCQLEDLCIERESLVTDNYFNNIGILLMGNLETTIKSIKLNNFYVGIVGQFNQIITVEELDMYIELEQLDDYSAGCLFFMNTNISLEKIHISNYFITVGAFILDNLSIKDINVTIDQLVPITVGIAAILVENTSIKNANISNYAMGILESFNLSISIENVNLNFGSQFQPGVSDPNVIAPRAIYDGTFGIYMPVFDYINAKNVSIKNINVYNYYIGIYARAIQGFIMENITIGNDEIAEDTFSVGFYQVGIDIEDCDNGILNTATINTVYNAINLTNSYNIKCSNIVIDTIYTGISSYGEWVNETYSYCNGIVINDCTISAAVNEAIDFVGAKSCEIKNCNIYGNNIGIKIRDDTVNIIQSVSNTVTNCNISQNSNIGILLDDTSFATVIDNNVITNNGTGLYINTNANYNIYVNDKFILNGSHITDLGSFNVSSNNLNTP